MFVVVDVALRVCFWLFVLMIDVLCCLCCVFVVCCCVCLCVFVDSGFFVHVVCSI